MISRTQVNILLNEFKKKFKLNNFIIKKIESDIYDDTGFIGISGKANIPIGPNNEEIISMSTPLELFFKHNNINVKFRGCEARGNEFWIDYEIIKGVKKMEKKTVAKASEKTRNYFTIYGRTKDTKKIEKLTKDMCNATFTVQQKQGKMNICDEAKIMLTKGKPNVYFSNQKLEGKKYGICKIKPEIRPTNNKLANMEFFVFGYSIDIDKAKELFEEAEKEEINVTTNTTNTNSFEAFENQTEDKKQTKNLENDPKFFALAEKLLEIQDKIWEKEKDNDYKEDVLKSVVDGQVFIKGKDIYVVTIGKGADSRIDKDAFIAGEPKLAEKYKTMQGEKWEVRVSDGIKKPNRKNLVNKDHIYNLTDNQLFDICNEYNTTGKDYKNLENKQSELASIIKAYIGYPLPKETKDYKTKQGNKELIVSIKYTNPYESIDTDRLKADGINYDAYKKPISAARYMSLKKLV